MVQSLNISVACAVTLYEGFRQRSLKGYYDGRSMYTPAEQEVLFERYAARELMRHKGRNAIKPGSGNAMD
jgi:tRNA (guanosine-2'-O-)-methyltransferase